MTALVVIVDLYREPLRTLAEDHIFERQHRHPQILILGVEREHHLGQSHCVSGKSFGANRHVQTIHALAIGSS